MLRHIAITSALLLFTATSALAQASTASQDTRGVVALERGIVTRVDPGANVIVLEDGRMFRVAPSTVLTVDNRPVEFRTVTPGTAVVIQAGDPVVYKGGQYVVVAPATPTTMVTTTPIVTTVPGVRQTIYGKVTDVDKDGQVTVKTDRGEFEMRVSPDATRTIRKGDTVTVDVSITPPGASPAASPRTR